MASQEKREKEPSEKAEQLREAIVSKLRAVGERPTTEGEPRAEGAPKRETVKAVLQTQIALFGPRLRDLAGFCRQLATLIGVGIPLVRCLKILAERTQHPKLRAATAQMVRDIEEGATFSAALAKHPKIIPPLMSNIVRIGEAGGILEASLGRLADIYEKKAEIKRKVVAALAYPTAALLVAIGVVFLVLAYSIPVFQQVYEQKEGVQLPGPTRVIIAASEFVRHAWPVYVPVVVIALIGLWIYGQTPAGRRLYDWLRLSLPVMGPVNVKINVARFTRTLASLLQAGVPLLEGLSATAQSSENVILAQTLERTRRNIEQGGKIEETLRESKAIPAIVTDMIAIGDEAGALDTMLERVANAYDGEVDIMLKGLVALIEPLLIIFLGCVVIFIALGVLLPYWRIGDVIE